MKKVVKAKIKWLTAEQGGRTTPLGFGFRYCPIVEFETQDKTGDTWSADIIWHSEIGTDLTTIADFSFFSEEAPFELLTPGSKFNLYEGSRHFCYRLPTVSA